MMAKKRQLTPDEVSELFSELDESGVLDPDRERDRERRLKFRVAAKKAGDKGAMKRMVESDRERRGSSKVDPLSAEDPSGSKVGDTITRTAVGFVLVVMVLIVGMQIFYGVSRRLNTSNLSESVTRETVTNALEGGLEWGNGFTQFPRNFTVDHADQRNGDLEVSVVDTDSANELELLSNGQIQAAALATNALLNDRIDTVTYNVYAYVDDDGNIQRDRLFGLLPATGTRRAILTFVWSKPSRSSTSSIDWELRIIGMDEQVTSRIQEQVNSVSSLIEDPRLTQDAYEEQQYEQMLERKLRGSEIFLGGPTTRTPEEVQDSVAAAEAEESDPAE